MISKTKCLLIIMILIQSFFSISQSNSNHLYEIKEGEYNPVMQIEIDFLILTNVNNSIIKNVIFISKDSITFNAITLAKSEFYKPLVKDTEVILYRHKEFMPEHETEILIRNGKLYAFRRGQFYFFF